MQPILANLVEMTGQRDHLRLELSVLSTLNQMPSVRQVRSLDIFHHANALFVRPRCWLHDDQWVTTAVHEPSEDKKAQPLTELPALSQCIAAHETSALHSPRKGVHVMWLPIWLHDQVHSCLEITQSRPFAQHKIHVIKSVFFVYQNYQNLLDYSERDALTGLFNRKTFDEEFSRRIAGNTHSATELGPEGAEQDVQQWLAVVDVDHFKQVNDRFGHLYGDEVLILMANILRNSFRAQDRIFRFGGEEFVVLLRSTTLEMAYRIFNRFREAVQDHHFPQVGKVTVSVGFVSTQEGIPVEILGHADQALYYAKDHGRNQVCFYGDLVKQGHVAATVRQDDVEFF
jgi:diguanylate cyclase (GGDEF)-like protein